MPFVPRLTDRGIRTSEYWQSNTNPYTASGYGMPNCTCYAWGRRWEIIGSPDSKLPTGNAQDWYAPAQARGYSVGQTPQLGAIACYGYRNSNVGGHVAIVEEINSNGSVRTSNSGWQSTYFWVDTIYPNNNYLPNWIGNCGGYFQGFIYLKDPPIENYRWHANGEQQGYAKESNEAFENGVMFYSILNQRGWSLNAIAAAWANIGHEGVYNPWMWGFDLGVQSTATYHNFPSLGYGLRQETPSWKYIDDPDAQALTGYAPHFSDREGDTSDGTAQTLWLDIQPDDVPYPVYGITSYADYKTSTETPYHLAEWFLRNYERPLESLIPSQIPLRGEDAEYWFNKLKDVNPFDPVNPTPSGPTKKGMPIWMMTGFINWW